MITNYNQFILEKNEWSKGIATVKIRGKNYSFIVKNLYEYVESKKFKIVDLKVKDIAKYSNYHSGFKNTMIKDDSTNNKWTKYDDLPKDKQKEISDQENKQIMTSNLKYPIIAIFNGKKYNIADGNHRLKKADIIGDKTIKAYVIREEDFLNSIENGELKTLDDGKNDIFDLNENVLNTDLEKLANDFLKKENITKEYLNKENRDGMCWWFAKNFSKFLNSNGVKNSIIDMKHKNKDGNHMVVQVKDNFIDFTERMVSNKFPAITKKSDYTTYDIFNKYNNFGEFIKKFDMTDEEWNKYEKKLKHPK